MGRRRNRSSHEYSHTPTTLMVALLGGSCAFIAVETTLPDVLDVWGSQMNKLPGWQFHMGSACSGIVTFFTFLFLLELHETKSRITAWRSSAPWLPLVGLTLLASIIRIAESGRPFPLISINYGFQSAVTAEVAVLGLHRGSGCI